MGKIYLCYIRDQWKIININYFYLQIWFFLNLREATVYFRKILYGKVFIICTTIKKYIFLILIKEK